MDGVNKNPGKEFDGKDLHWLIGEYLAESEKRVSKTTFKDYRYLLNYFSVWWSQVGPTCNWTVRRTSFYDYVEWLRSQPSRQGERLGLRTIDAALKRLRQLFKWASVEEHFQKDYSKWIPALPDEPPTRQAPDPECLHRLFEAANHSEKPIRNKTILAILCGTAIRRTECTQVNIENVQFFADGSGQIQILRGKGYKPRIVVFDDITGHYIALHLALLSELGITSGPLFIGRGGRLTPKGLYDVVKVAAEQAGLADMIQGPHDLRRMFATHWTRAHRGEGSIQPLSIQLGHTGNQMTLHYSKQTLADVRDIFVSPMEKMRKT